MQQEFSHLFQHRISEKVCEWGCWNVCGFSFFLSREKLLRNNLLCRCQQRAPKSHLFFLANSLISEQISFFLLKVRRFSADRQTQWTFVIVLTRFWFLLLQNKQEEVFTSIMLSVSYTPYYCTAVCHRCLNALNLFCSVSGRTQRIKSRSSISCHSWGFHVGFEHLSLLPASGKPLVANGVLFSLVFVRFLMLMTCRGTPSSAASMWCLIVLGRGKSCVIPIKGTIPTLTRVILFYRHLSQIGQWLICVQSGDR